jgi:hypothetical protein
MCFPRICSLEGLVEVGLMMCTLINDNMIWEHIYGCLSLILYLEAHKIVHI